MLSRHQLPPFPESYLEKIREGRTLETFPKDRVVYTQGEPAHSIYFIHNGRAKVTVVSEQGREAVIAIVEDGDFIGEGCLAGERRRMATVVALQDCEMSRIEKATMLRLLRDEPKFSLPFIDYLLDRNMRIQEDLIDQLFNSSERRLARLLLILANFGKDDFPQVVTPRISQETLAERIGTTRARVSYFMNKFRRLGLIEYNGEIKVHNSLLNVILGD